MQVEQQEAVPDSMPSLESQSQPMSMETTQPTDESSATGTGTQPMEEVPAETTPPPKQPQDDGKYNADNSDDDYVNEDCGVCAIGGDLLCCDGTCNRAFHFNCVGLDALPAESEQWFCEDCRRLKEDVSSLLS
jgi:hypothetical protein